MATLEEQFQQACDAGRIPGVVLVASDSTGEWTARGPRNCETDNVWQVNSSMRRRLE